jgi:hypothetical protein
MWLESRLLLQIAVADGRADGDPDNDDRAVSEKNVHGGGRPTEALEAVLSPTRLVFSRIVTLHFQSERSDVFNVFFFSLEAYGLVQGDYAGVMVGRIGNGRLGVRAKG